MISCKEFIPLYNELFKYLEERGGHDEVAKHWEYISDSTVSDSLGKHVAEKGIRGCWDYWSKSLNEEACDFHMELDEASGTFLIDMRKCPSKGQLVAYDHVEPYYDYCGHCPALYNRVLEKYGIHPVSIEVPTGGTLDAKCKLMYVSDVKKPDGEKLSMDRNASDNEYFHRAFHISKNRGFKYLAQLCGEEAVVEHLTRFTKSFYAPLIERIKKNGLSEMQKQIEKSYADEKTPDNVECKLNGEELYVKVIECPALSFIKSAGYEIASCYIEETRTVNRVIAECSGYNFELISYDAETGAAEYRFFK